MISLSDLDTETAAVAAALRERRGRVGAAARNHVSRIMAKLHAADRARAIVPARDAGLCDPLDR